MVKMTPFETLEPFRKSLDQYYSFVHCHQIEFVHSIPLLTLEPHRVIFYRDGVSNGQFNQVLLHEIDSIRKSCASLGMGDARSYHAYTTILPYSEYFSSSRVEDFS